jgi:hypothetical protein
MITKDFSYDIGYTEAGLDVLKDYLLSEEMFWPLSVHPPSGEPPYPRFTLGGLLLSLKRLSAYHKSSTQEEQLNRVNLRLDFIRSQWRAAWEKKAGYNFNTRLHMWREFIEEYRNSPQENADRYPYEVRLRVMLHLLQGQSGRLETSTLDLLKALDIFLKATLARGSFVWEAELQNGFPVSDYWYLYGSLPASVIMV